MSLQTLADKVNKDPTNTDAILEEYLLENSKEAVTQNLQVIVSQLERLRHIFTGIENALDTETGIRHLLIATSNSLRQTLTAFQVLTNEVRKREQ